MFPAREGLRPAFSTFSTVVAANRRSVSSKRRIKTRLTQQQCYPHCGIGEVFPAREGLRLMVLTFPWIPAGIGEVFPAREGLRRCRSCQFNNVTNHRRSVSSKRRIKTVTWLIVLSLKINRRSVSSKRRIKTHGRSMGKNRSTKSEKCFQQEKD